MTISESLFKDLFHPVFDEVFESFILWQMNNRDVEDDSTGAAYYINDAGEIVTVPAESPLYFDGKFWNIGSFHNYLANPLSPATQTTGDLWAEKYTLWMRGTGSVAVSANTATITGAGSASEGNPLHFSVTVAGTVNVTVSGNCTVFQLTNTKFSTEPFLSTSISTVASRAGTISVPLTDGTKPYTLLDGESFKLKFDWTPNFSYDDMNLSSNASILNSNSSIKIFYVAMSGSKVGYINGYDGSTFTYIPFSFQAFTCYEVCILWGNNHPSYPGTDKYRIQIRTKGSSTWTKTNLANFDGSFNPDTELIIGYNNDYPFSITKLIFTACRPKDWE